MGNLWQFFGLPDPELPPEIKRKKATPTNKVEPSGQQMTLGEPEVVLPKKVQLPRGWSGPITPDGEAFHDLSMYKPAVEEHPDRALRYVSPDHMHRLPIRELASRIDMGDTIIVDLRTLIHMETQQNACRRQLKVLGDEMGIPIFALDAQDKLLLLPGNDVTVDVSRNELGLIPLLI